jgi:DNA replication protein DnaC
MVCSRRRSPPPTVPADFDWDWPKHCDRAALQELMTLSFMLDATNVVLVGPNGVGKSMLACNLGHQALIEGRTVLFTTAGQLLGDLAALPSRSRDCPAQSSLPARTGDILVAPMATVSP